MGLIVIQNCIKLSSVKLNAVCVVTQTDFRQEI